MKILAKWEDRHFFGETAFNEWGDLVSKECAGMKISKRRDLGDDPGGIVYEAERIGLPDLWELLECLEGMCHEGYAREIDDSTYYVFTKEEADKIQKRRAERRGEV